MADLIRYQVFISSTYTDLKEERAEVIQALWELDCIPTGMEVFLASSSSQWEIIRKVIDECNYYLLIIGGRYGSLTSENISFTEKEYDYAKSLDIPILAFVHSSPETIPSGKVEIDLDSREKLKQFRARVMEEYPIREWSTADQLGSVASRSLVREIRQSPRLGWVRNGDKSPSELLRKIAELSAENAELNKKLALARSETEPLSNLSQGDDKVTLSGMVELGSTIPYVKKRWKYSVSWNNVFIHLAPVLLREANEKQIARYLG